MKKLTISMGIFLTLAAVGAHAHAHLKGSNPSEGAVISEMPPAIVLTFLAAARITAVSIQKNQETKHVLQAPAAVAKRISVVVPKLGSGSYTLTWRVVSPDDNHIMSGELHFKVAASTTMNVPMKP